MFLVIISYCFSLRLKLNEKACFCNGHAMNWRCEGLET